jgi:nitrate reductase (cytochrome), electron transfer subunit
MSQGPDRQLPTRVFGIGSAIVIMVAATVLLAPTVWPAEDEDVVRPATRLAPATTVIRGEADVFRTWPEQFAARADAAPRVEAHPRSMAMHRRLRAYPGAPPRIPHAITKEEARGGTCSACHERGGFVERFSAYAPLTPHPDFGQCLQCHVPDDRLVGLAPPTGRGPEAACSQCHVLDARTPSFRATDWHGASWPDLGLAALPGAPPAIPHDIQLRGNCLACHAGPGAVEEVRTTHPERGNCRQCHVPNGEDGEVFQRAVAGGGS